MSQITDVMLCVWMPQVAYLTDKYDIIEVNTRCNAIAYVYMAS